ncbi:YSIRK-type signal peptide-containing protein [Streptococcus pluranimalium]
MKKTFDSKQIFSIRKFKAYGTASALLGLAALSAANQVQAEEATSAPTVPTTGAGDTTVATAPTTSGEVIETDNLIINQEGSTPPPSGGGGQ